MKLFDACAELHCGTTALPVPAQARILHETSAHCSLPDLAVAASLELMQEAKRRPTGTAASHSSSSWNCRINICDTPVKAVDMLMQENIQPVAPKDAKEPIPLHGGNSRCLHEAIRSNGG
ncbi:uncharacterized protein PITG_09746 [Phytophthora infestans T30-4]|uniref:Uncharacterized protein n=1 Tax=Phytophthora infestans (strain T30-4) TaxID=403677 RepID=D0NCQ1_PHYIT|nr:uncharacterized protein PITG_09746 [Phytophthora infestans T30-4]EEY55765.1 hypothetical protein PITG_09746 [Phytophthora infestans T30-4]|eukprot:XP_002903341.1 hypothetical protein PITG_09746 [Phytophthora infestans T30-4]